MSTARSYQSPLREAQAGMTRERILMAAKGYLEENDIETLTPRRVAELAGVSTPTVYAYFRTVDDLVGAFFQWLKPRLGLQQPLPPLDALAEMPSRLFPLYDEYGALLRNLMNKPAWDRQRAADRGQRHGQWIAAMAAELPHLTPAQVSRGALAVAAFWSPTHWRWLMDTCQFSPHEAQAVAGWTIRSLVAALRTDASGLDFPATPTPNAEQEVPA